MLGKIALVSVVTLLVSCSGNEAPCACSKTTDRQVGTLVAHWSQADYPGLGPAYGERAETVVSTSAELDDFLRALPPRIDPAPLRDIDLTASVLVAGAYPRCDESGRVEAPPVRFVVVEPADRVVCDWSPVELEVWEVPRSEL